MNLADSNILNIWSEGQLLAFSGIDGKTDTVNGLTARTAFNKTGLDIKLPVECSITFANTKPSNVFLAGDFFILETNDEKVKGAFSDAHHLLIEGKCLVSDSSLEMLQVGNQTLIGVKEYFDKKHLNLDIDQVIAQRFEWLGKQELPGSSQNSEEF